MKYICKEDFEINGFLIGNKGDVLDITDAVPSLNETLEDVAGYCDILNVNTKRLFEATWIDVSDFLEPIKE